MNTFFVNKQSDAALGLCQLTLNPRLTPLFYRCIKLSNI